ncbi:hypothetical protein N5C81_14300 [Rhizobium pusense]|uniref:hypothetical protein n=1 Tax=Agrobacterium pusense TaxID=648995 RepID=UPI0024473414|nr:hypothetical protein [Agrobacterium pusense]MDH1268793.1 hypothetical protein [Agrobacterium pusense]
MARHLTETEKMISDAALRAYATAWKEIWGEDEPRLLVSPSIDETKEKIRRIFRSGRKVPATLESRSALERSEG